ncbi:conserved hypothetical protein [Ricinus communis]|uniref:Uncharacterized protein n=1 Tax=Ricinus communis TaxID=3988 RepID=B9SEZ4_RICCO|nr:conserved hypothetical protein [Ricinus communis]
MNLLNSWVNRTGLEDRQQMELESSDFAVELKFVPCQPPLNYIHYVYLADFGRKLASVL